MVVVTVFGAIERQHGERGCTRRRGEERPGAGKAVGSAGGGWRGVPSAAPAPPRARRAHGGNGRGTHQSRTRNFPLSTWFCIFSSQKLMLAITWLRVETEGLSRFSLKPAGCPCSSVVRARDFYLGNPKLGIAWVRPLPGKAAGEGLWTDSRGFDAAAGSTPARGIVSLFFAPPSPRPRPAQPPDAFPGHFEVIRALQVGLVLSTPVLVRWMGREGAGRAVHVHTLSTPRSPHPSPVPKASDHGPSGDEIALGQRGRPRQRRPVVLLEDIY